jgi:hypothetical protein
MTSVNTACGALHLRLAIHLKICGEMVDIEFKEIHIKRGEIFSPYWENTLIFVKTTVQCLSKRSFMEFTCF